MALPVGVSITDINAAIPIVQAAITRCSLGGGAANPGLQFSLSQGLAALGDMLNSQNPNLYGASQWSGWSANMLTMQAMAAANGDGAAALSYGYAAQVFATL